MREATTTHTAANCQSTRLGFRLSFVGEANQPESLWVCTRDGSRRSVTDAECAECDRWEAAEQGQPVAAPVFLSSRWRE